MNHSRKEVKMGEILSNIIYSKAFHPMKNTEDFNGFLFVVIN